MLSDTKRAQTGAFKEHGGATHAVVHGAALHEATGICGKI